MISAAPSALLLFHPCSESASDLTHFLFLPLPSLPPFYPKSVVFVSTPFGFHIICPLSHFPTLPVPVRFSPPAGPSVSTLPTHTIHVHASRHFSSLRLFRPTDTTQHLDSIFTCIGSSTLLYRGHLSSFVACLPWMTKGRSR